jgi:hypothetical protein
MGEVIPFARDEREDDADRKWVRELAVRIDERQKAVAATGAAAAMRPVGDTHSELELAYTALFAAYDLIESQGEALRLFAAAAVARGQR